MTSHNILDVIVKGLFKNNHLILNQLQLIILNERH